MDNGDGTWTYNYAVYNMNVQRAFGGFAVPLGVDVDVTGVGFHDVDGHSGDPFSNDDWSSQVLADEVRWSTEDHASNPMANPIRWGTLYTLWFTADAGPQQVAASVELFQPGVPGAVALDVCAPMDGTGGGCGWIPFCQTAPNSQGVGATISANGSAVVTDNDLVLHVGGAVPGQPGLFYYGAGQANAPFGDGFRCVDGPTFLLNPPTPVGPSGDATRRVDLTQPPANAGPGEITPGSVWNFQYWYRDPANGMSGFNLSDALEVTFCP